MDRHNQGNYVIDANILINFGIYTPRNIHQEFWIRFEEAVQNKKIIIIKEVADECRIGDIKIWVNEQRKADRITNVSASIKDRASEINDEYPLINDEWNPKTRSYDSKSDADPVIIAYAETNDYTVFTQESDREIQQGRQLVNSQHTPMKIPAVCKELDIPYIRYPSKVLEKIMYPIG